MVKVFFLLTILFSHLLVVKTNEGNFSHSNLLTFNSEYELLPATRQDLSEVKFQKKIPSFFLCLFIAGQLDSPRSSALGSNQEIELSLIQSKFSPDLPRGPPLFLS